MRLAAGLRQDPLGELQRFPRPSSRNQGRGPTSKGKEEKRDGREGKEEEREGKKGGKGG